MMPCLTAYWTNSALVLMLSCCIIRYLWNSTVLVEISRMDAISLAGLPFSQEL